MLQFSLPARSTHNGVVCSTVTPAHLKAAAQKTAGALLGTLAAASLALTPLPAHAVSGGGGMGSSLSFKDLTGQDFRKANFTKADLRGANFSGANLEVRSLLPDDLCAQSQMVLLQYLRNEIQ